MNERGLSPRTVRYAHVPIKCAMQKAMRWRLLLDSSCLAKSNYRIHFRRAACWEIAGQGGHRK